MTDLVSDEALSKLVADMQGDHSDVLARLDAVLADYPADARLHFMRGSYLASAGRLIEAHYSLSRAVEIAPDFPIARFQLGLFQLTSGETANALDTWGRLDALPDGHYLREFTDGLRCLVRDDFAGAIRHLRAGMALNQENPPLNRDMQLLIDRCTPLLDASPDDSSDVSSETALILRQFSERKLH